MRPLTVIFNKSLKKGVVPNSWKEADVVGEGGHVRIGKVQHTLAKAVHALGCLYLVIILSNYSRVIMLVKKLQFPP